MLLKEMFSPLGGPKDTDKGEIDWTGDLKLFIDDHDSLLTRFIMPAIDKHKKFVGHPKAYTIYVKPLQKCAEQYCEAMKLENVKEIFPPERIIDLAKQYCDQQSRFIERGDYK